MAYKATKYNVDDVGLGKFLDDFGHGPNKIDIVESLLVHTDHSGDSEPSDFSKRGDMVSFGARSTGVVVTGRNSTAETDTVVVQIEGIAVLLVEAHDGTNPDAITIGDPVYLQPDGTIDTNSGAGLLCGVSMTVLAGGAAGVRCAVRLTN